VQLIDWKRAVGRTRRIDGSRLERETKKADYALLVVSEYVACPPFMYQPLRESVTFPIGRAERNAM
jgi:hypothetical protein